MSQDYQTFGKRTSNFEKTDIDTLAYIVTRMPATYAALKRVFQELKRRLPAFLPTSLIDIGAGPATTLWAANDFFPELQNLSFIEKDKHVLALGKRLAEDLSLYSRSQWTCADMRSDLSGFSSDLVVASYCIGEIQERERDVLIKKLWGMTKKVLIVVEPGTPKGFEILRKLRKELLNIGAHLIAPCPHRAECPLLKGDWCHFYARLNRSSLHRRAKEADLNYEDEKFSYFIFSRENGSQCASRIVRHPRKGKGHVVLNLCTSMGVEETIITKKEGELYKVAKKSDWGDAIPSLKSRR